MFDDTTFARRPGTVQSLEVRMSGRGETAEVLLDSTDYRHCHIHRLTLGEAESLARDLLQRVKDCRKEAKRKARR